MNDDGVQSLVVYVWNKWNAWDYNRSEDSHELYADAVWCPDAMQQHE